MIFKRNLIEVKLVNSKYLFILNVIEFDRSEFDFKHMPSIFQQYIEARKFEYDSLNVIFVSDTKGIYEHTERERMD
jgi:hypothetical protein